MMQIVIDIPKEMYENALNGYLCGSEILVNAIKNGIALPKGHGRLIDADYKISSDGRTVNSVCGYMASTIVEADRSEEE